MLCRVVGLRLTPALVMLAPHLGLTGSPRGLNLPTSTSRSPLKRRVPSRLGRSPPRRSKGSLRALLAAMSLWLQIHLLIRVFPGLSARKRQTPFTLRLPHRRLENRQQPRNIGQRTQALQILNEREADMPPLAGSEHSSRVPDSDALLACAIRRRVLNPVPGPTHLAPLLRRVADTGALVQS